jgi:hypothetical protein
MAKINHPTFETQLLCPAKPGADGSWAFLILPRAESDKLPRRGRTTVEGAVNGAISVWEFAGFSKVGGEWRQAFVGEQAPVHLTVKSDGVRDFSSGRRSESDDFSRNEGALAST